MRHDDLILKHADEIEFQYMIKLKIEKLLSALIKFYELQPYISDRYQFRLQTLDELTNTKLYEYYQDNRNDKGEKLPYNVRYDIEEFGFESWLEYNFKDFVKTSELYIKFIRFKFLEEKDLNKMNDLYKNYE